MPFDVKGFQPYTLTDHLASIGITPVPMAVLTAHKADQERKHPESLLNPEKTPHELNAVNENLAMCQGKQKVDPGLALSRAQEMDDRIRAMAQNRDMTNNERVQDVVGFCDEGWYW